MGKSTLLNHILGQKISITSRKPQTTRFKLLGVDTEGIHQAIYIDTPGIHLAAHRVDREGYVWTVNDPVSMSAAVSRGVDALITDRPAVARAVRADVDRL